MIDSFASDTATDSSDSSDLIDYRLDEAIVFKNEKDFLLTMIKFEKKSWTKTL